jgi:hypothetical protein
MSDENNTVNPQALSVLDFEELDQLLNAYNDLAFLLPVTDSSLRILDVLNQSFAFRLEKLKAACFVK